MRSKLLPLSKNLNSTRRGAARLFCSILLLIILLSFNNYIFATSISATATGGNWSSSVTWTGGVVPGLNDDVTIPVGSSVVVNGVYSCNSLNISTGNGNTTLTINASQSLAVTGQLTLPAPGGGSSNVNSIAINGILKAATLAIGGTGSRGATVSVGSNGTLEVVDDLTFGTGSVNSVSINSGTLALGGSSTKISTILGNASLTINTSASPFGTVNFNGTSSQTIPANTYGNIKINNAGGVIPAANITTGTTSTCILKGNLTVESGQFDSNGKTIAATTGQTLQVNNGATLILSGTSVFPTSFPIVTLQPISTVNFAGTSGTQTIPVYTYGNLQASGAGAKNLGGNISAKDIAISGGTLTVGSTQTLSVSGSLQASAPLTLATGSTVVFNGTSGSQVIPVYSYTNLQASGAATKSLGGSLSVKDISISGSTLTVGSGQILSVTGSLPASASLVFDPASTVNFNGALAQTIPANTYGNIKINNAAGATLGMNLTTANLKGNLIVESGILDNGVFSITGTAGQTLQVDNGASLALSNSSTFPASFGTVILGATSNTIYQGATQVIDSRTYGNLQINGTAGKTLNGNVVTNNVSFGGSGSLAVGASQTFTVNGSLPASAPITLDPASTVTFSGAAAQAIPVNTYGTLVLDKAANKTLAGNITVKDISFTGTGSGTLTVAASQTVNISGSLPAAAPLTLDAASTINFNGTSAQIIPVYTYGNIKINNTAGVTLGGALTSSNLKGNLTIESGKFDNGGFALAATSGKTLQVNNGATLVLSGITTFPTSFSTVTLQPSSTVNFNGFGAQNIPNYTYGNIKINNTSSSGATLGMSVTTVNVLGSIVVESGTLSVDNLTTITGVSLTVNNSATMAVAGDFSTFVVTLQPTSTINFNGTSAQTIPSYTYGNIKINNTSSGGATLGMNVTTTNVTGNIAVESGVLNIGSATTITGTPIFVGNSSTLAVAGNFPASAVTLQVSSILNFNGASTQNIPSRSYGILKFTGAGTKTLDGNITAGNTLVASPIDLSNGGIDIGGNTLTLNTAGSISGASTANYIKLGSGKMIIENLGSTGRDGQWLFPVGTTSSYTPASIINAGANNDFSVNVVDGIKDRFNNVVNNNVVKKTWNVSRETSNGAVDVTLKLQWNNTDEAYDAAIPTNTFNRNTSTINHYENGGWNQVATSSLVEVGTTYSVTASGIKTFSPFGVADNNNPLPVELSYFKAINNAGKAKLEWATATEKNNKGFNIQVSADGKRFESIGFIASKNENSTSLQQYEFNDKENRTGLWYFRLQQVDLSGEVNYSGSKVIDFGIRASSVQVYPNPCQNELALKIDLIAASDTEIQLRDLAGKTVASQVQKLFPGSTTIPLTFEKDKPSGVYILTIKTGTEVFTNKIIKL